MHALAFKILMALPQIIAAVESLVKGKGKAKQDAAVELAKTTLVQIEGVTGKDLLDDAEVEAATRGVIDASVHLKNVIEDAKRRRQPPPSA